MAFSGVKIPGHLEASLEFKAARCGNPDNSNCQWKASDCKTQWQSVASTEPKMKCMHANDTADSDLW